MSSSTPTPTPIPDDIAKLNELKLAIIDASVKLTKGTLSGVDKEGLETAQNIYEELFNNISSDETKLHKLLEDINKFDITAFRNMFSTSKADITTLKNNLLSILNTPTILNPTFGTSIPSSTTNSVVDFTIDNYRSSATYSIRLIETNVVGSTARFITPSSGSVINGRIDVGSPSTPTNSFIDYIIEVKERGFLSSTYMGRIAVTSSTVTKDSSVKISPFNSTNILSTGIHALLINGKLYSDNSSFNYFDTKRYNQGAGEKPWKDLEPTLTYDLTPFDIDSSSTNTKLVVFGELNSGDKVWVTDIVLIASLDDFKELLLSSSNLRTLNPTLPTNIDHYFPFERYFSDDKDRSIRFTAKTGHMPLVSTLTNSMFFDGTNVIQATLPLGVLTKFSISFTAKFDKIVRDVIFSIDDDIYLEFTNSTTLHLYTPLFTVDLTVPSNIDLFNSLNHYAIYIDGTKFEFYYNGNKVDSMSSTLSTALRLNVPNQKLYLGGYYDGSEKTKMYIKNLVITANKTHDSSFFKALYGYLFKAKEIDISSLNFTNKPTKSYKTPTFKDVVVDSYSSRPIVSTRIQPKPKDDYTLYPASNLLEVPYQRKSLSAFTGLVVKSRIGKGDVLSGLNIDLWKEV